VHHATAIAAATKDKKQAGYQLALTFYETAVRFYPEHLPSQQGLAQVILAHEFNSTPLVLVVACS
jgi:hypothetical protein